MFCLNCEAEYREGFTECSDCRVPLIDKLPEVPTEPEESSDTDPDATFVEILRTESLTDVAMIKAALDAEKVQYFIQGEMMNLLRPLGECAILFVAEKDADRAIDLLKELKLNYVRMILGGGGST